LENLIFVLLCGIAIILYKESSRIVGMTLLERIVVGEWGTFSIEEREPFLAFMGVSAQSNHKAPRIFRKTTNDSSLLSLLEQKAKELGVQSFRYGSQHLYVYQSRLMKLIFKAMHDDFDTFLMDNSTRRTFLKYFFKSSKAEPKKRGDTFGYLLRCSNSNTRQKLLETLVHVGIYPRTSGKAITIEGVPNLHHFLNLDLEDDAISIIGMENYLRSHPQLHSDELHKYYAALSMARAGHNNVHFIAEKVGRTPNAVRYWISDVLRSLGHRNNYRHKRPPIVRTYEDVLEKVRLPNPYLADQAVWVKGQLFLPVDHWTYAIGAEVQGDFTKRMGPLDADNLKLLAHLIQTSDSRKCTSLPQVGLSSYRVVSVDPTVREPTEKVKQKYCKLTSQVHFTEEDYEFLQDEVWRDPGDYSRMFKLEVEDRKIVDILELQVNLAISGKKFNVPFEIRNQYRELLELDGPLTRGDLRYLKKQIIFSHLADPLREFNVCWDKQGKLTSIDEYYPKELPKREFDFDD
jgi:hypothetical protein